MNCYSKQTQSNPTRGEPVESIYGEQSRTTCSELACGEQAQRVEPSKGSNLFYPPLRLFTRLWRGGNLSNLSAALFGGNSHEFLIDFDSN